MRRAYLFRHWSKLCDRLRLIWSARQAYLFVFVLPICIEMCVFLPEEDLRTSLNVERHRHKLNIIFSCCLTLYTFGEISYHGCGSWSYPCTSHSGVFPPWGLNVVKLEMRSDWSGLQILVCFTWTLKMHNCAALFVVMKEKNNKTFFRIPPKKPCMRNYIYIFLFSFVFALCWAHLSYL